MALKVEIVAEALKMNRRRRLKIASVAPIQAG